MSVSSHEDEEDPNPNPKSPKNNEQHDCNEESNNTTIQYPNERFLHLRSFLTLEQQKELSKCALQCHHQNEANKILQTTNSDTTTTITLNNNSQSVSNNSKNTYQQHSHPWNDLETCTKSKTLNLGSEYCGASLQKNLPLAMTFALQAFQHTLDTYQNYLKDVDTMDYNDCNPGMNDTIDTCSRVKEYIHELSSLLHPTCTKSRDDIDSSLSSPQATTTTDTSSSTSTTSKPCTSTTPLTGLALIYGPNASMPSHYDSPTQDNQKYEWTCMLSVGSTIRFRCNQHVIDVHSGDAVVMDSMKVLHGVESVLDDSENDDNDNIDSLPAVHHDLVHELKKDMMRQSTTATNQDCDAFNSLKALRLGIILWKSAPPPPSLSAESTSVISSPTTTQSNNIIDQESLLTEDFGGMMNDMFLESSDDES